MTYPRAARIETEQLHESIRNERVTPAAAILLWMTLSLASWAGIAWSVAQAI